VLCSVVYESDLRELVSQSVIGALLTKVGGLSGWPQRSIEKLPQMAKGQTVCKELKNPEQIPNYLDVTGQGPH